MLSLKTTIDNINLYKLDPSAPTIPTDPGSNTNM